VSQPQGFALLCDTDGNLTKILGDSFNLGAELHPGMPFTRLAARGALAKVLSFLTEIKTKGAAYDWEINLVFGDRVQTMHLVGGLFQEQLLIAGDVNSQRVLQLLESIMQINNEQTNALRAAYQEQAHDYRQFDEFSRLNNELVSMQRELSKKNAELERLNQEKNRFLGMAAHDLRNPLQLILSHSTFLREEAASLLSPEYLSFLETISVSSEFMAHLVDDLLDVAKIESGLLSLDYSPVALVALLERNVAMNRVLAAKKKVDLVLKVETEPLRALVDAPKIEQVLNNLLGNAIKFSSDGGRVELCLGREGENFQIRIQDEGPGISAEDQAKLFKPFQRGQPGTAGEKSSGLGLAIVKRIVEGHGGKIWLNSSLGQGTTFFISIPFQPNF
jgi:signal transduction histidine kinase